MSNVLMIAVAEARMAVERAVAADPTLDLEGRLRAAFAVTRNHWMVTNEDERFRTGVGGVLVTATDAGEKARIEAELASLRALSAAMSGVPVDFGAVLSDKPEPIGMLAIWREGREGS